MSATKKNYTQKELKQFETKIDEMIEKTKEEISYAESQIKEVTEMDENVTSFGDEGNAQSEISMLSKQLEREQEQLTKLLNAKLRIENGTYGICSVSGNLIDKKRLEAIPYTTKCVKHSH